MIRRLLITAAILVPAALAESVLAADVEYSLVSHCTDCAAGSCSAGSCGDGCSQCTGGQCTGGVDCAGGSCTSSGGFGLSGGGSGTGKLFGLLGQDSPWNIGGWLQTGYHTEGNGLFNDHPSRLNLHQGWMYIERVADGSNGLALGGRMDLMYGVDSADTQAFGGTGFDTNWNRGAGYGWAMPQLYAEIATENSSTIVGHFFTLAGYEVVAAPNNFFYSHSMTMYNSEPFTHTGVLNSYNVSDSFTSYAGWTAGWDTGFQRNMNGSSFLGGFSQNIGDGTALTYITTFGNLGARSAGFNGYSHSVVFDTALTNKLNYVFQTDVLRVQGTGEDNVGINQYLFYTVSDSVGLGSRLEWWKGDDITGYNYGGRSAMPVSSTSYYGATFGVNYRPSDNIVIRPEVRFDWSPALGYDETTWGIDWVTVF